MLKPTDEGIYLLKVGDNISLQIKRQKKRSNTQQKN